jgi:hypothetical protein
MEVSTGSDRRHWAGSYLPGAATHSIGAVHVPASSGGGGRQWRSHATRDLQLRGHGAAKKTRLCGGTTHHTSCWRRGWTHCARPLLPLRHHGVGHWCYMETATATSMGWVVGDSFHGGWEVHFDLRLLTREYGRLNGSTVKMEDGTAPDREQHGWSPWGCLWWALWWRLATHQRRLAAAEGLA